MTLGQWRALGLGAETTWMLVQALFLSSSVSLSEILHLSESHMPQAAISKLLHILDCLPLSSLTSEVTHLFFTWTRFPCEHHFPWLFPQLEVEVFGGGDHSLFILPSLEPTIIPRK